MFDIFDKPTEKTLTRVLLEFIYFYTTGPSVNEEVDKLGRAVVHRTHCSIVGGFSFINC